MIKENTLVYGGLIVLALGTIYLVKSSPKRSNGEAENIIEQDCLNAGKEQNIPEQNLGKFVEDCKQALLEEERI